MDRTQIAGTPGLRNFMEEYWSRYRDDVLEIKDEMSVEFDTTTYSVLRNRSNRMLLFSNIKGYENFRLLANALGSENRVLFATGSTDIEEFNWKFSSILESEVHDAISLRSGSAPFMKNVLSSHSVDIFRLPIPSHYPSDGSRTGKSKYITSGIVAVREFDNPERINLSFTRIQPISRNRYAFDAGSHGHLWNHLRIAAQNGMEAELTVLIGCHPLYYLLAASFIDNEYEKASALMDAELSKGLKNDIIIPTETEIVMEAKFVPAETYDEGPFAEYAGYMGQDTTRYVAEVKSIMMRDNPIYYDIRPSNSTEHVNTFSLPRSSAVNGKLRRIIPQGTDFGVEWPYSGARFLSIAWVEPPARNVAKQLGISIMSTDPLWGKVIFVNLGKCDLDFTSAIARFLNTSEKASQCIAVFDDMFVISSDFTAKPEGNVGKALFITNSRDNSFTSELVDGEFIMRGKYGSAVITHSPGNRGRITIVVGRDIDVSDADQVLWALATRVNPSVDLEVNEDSIAINASRETPEIPGLDPDSVRRILDRFPAQPTEV
ncbi:MAG: UbiD family decarboxylase [Thermoplasmataceae archaeon]